MSEITDVFDVVDGAVVLRVHAQAGGGRSAVVGRYGDAIKIRVAAPADKGRANAELCAFLAREFGIPQRRVEVIAGLTSPIKVVRVTP